MNAAKRRFLLGSLKLFNLGLMVLSFVLATVLLFPESSKGATLPAFLSMRVKLSNFAIFVVMLCVWHAILSICGLYQSKRLETQISLIIDGVKATTLATISLLIVVKLFGVAMVTSQFVLLFWMFSSGLIVGGRVMIRYVTPPSPFART